MTAQERLAPGRYRLTVDDYRRLADAGAFGDERTELIEGDIWVMSPTHAPHALVHFELSSRLAEAVRASGSGLCGMSDVSVLVADDTMPRPDLVLAALECGQRVVTVAEVRLIVEIADASLTHDLDHKQAIYAVAGVPEYWIADVSARVVHQLWHPNGTSYTERRLVSFGDPITAATIAALIVTTDGL